jgi:hypothetical protein
MAFMLPPSSARVPTTVVTDARGQSIQSHGAVDPNITCVESSGVRIFAPGYEYAKPTPTAWIEADKKHLPAIVNPSHGRRLHILTTENLEGGRVRVHVNLMTQQSAERFNELSGGHFEGRLKALRDLLRLEDASRAAGYQGLEGIPDVAAAYNLHYGQMQKAFGAFCAAENSLKYGTQGVTEESLAELKRESDTKMAAYNDFMQELRDAYLRSKGYEPIDPVAVRDAWPVASQQEAPVSPARPPRVPAR